jgi:hypothetical protein
VGSLLLKKNNPIFIILYVISLFVPTSILYACKDCVLADVAKAQNIMFKDIRTLSLVMKTGQTTAGKTENATISYEMEMDADGYRKIVMKFDGDDNKQMLIDTKEKSYYIPGASGSLEKHDMEDTMIVAGLATMDPLGFFFGRRITDLCHNSLSDLKIPGIETGLYKIYLNPDMCDKNYDLLGYADKVTACASCPGGISPIAGRTEKINLKTGLVEEAEILDNSMRKIINVKVDEKKKWTGNGSGNIEFFKNATITYGEGADAMVMTINIVSAKSNGSSGFDWKKCKERKFKFQKNSIFWR